MTRFVSENNLPALLTRLKALDDQTYEKVSNLVPVKLSDLLNDPGYQSNAQVVSTINSEVTPITSTEINNIWNE